MLILSYLDYCESVIRITHLRFFTITEYLYIKINNLNFFKIFRNNYSIYEELKHYTNQATILLG